MKKATISLLIAATLLFSACDQGEMTLPNDNTLLTTSEQVLGKSFDEAKAYLLKEGYAVGEHQEMSNLYYFDRGEKNEAFRYEVEEQMCLFVVDDNVRYVKGTRCFHNIHDALRVYCKWSEYTWKHVVPNPDFWNASISQLVRDKETGATTYDYRYFYEGNYPVESFAEEEIGDRKAYESTIAALNDVEGVYESYVRYSAPKEVRLDLIRISKQDWIWIRYDTQNYLTEPMPDM